MNITRLPTSPIGKFKISELYSPAEKFQTAISVNSFDRSQRGQTGCFQCKQHRGFAFVRARSLDLDPVKSAKRRLILFRIINMENSRFVYLICIK